MRFFAAAGLVMILAGVSAYYTIGELSLFSIANLLIGPAVLLVAVALEARRFRGFSGSRSRRMVLRWTGVCAAVLVAIIAANVLGASWRARLDLTESRQYTLSEQTLSLCAELEASPGSEPLELLLLKDALRADDVRLLIAAYEAGCPMRMRELDSADAPPGAKAIVEAYDTTVVACLGARCDYVGYPSEENITNALLRLLRQTAPKVYFTIGHGEADLASERDHGFSALTTALRNEGMELSAFVGVAHSEVPDDASLLVIARPERNLLEAEIEALDRYLARGGRLLVLIEPAAETNLIGLLERWGFGLPPAIVADRQSSPLLEEPQPVSLVVNAFAPNHPVTHKMSRRTMVVMAGVRPVLPERKPAPQDRMSGLAFSSRSAWAEPDVSAALSGGEIGPEGSPMSGFEIPLAAAGRYPRGDGVEARIVVVGDSDFASNRWLRALYNQDLVLNSVLWLAQDDERVAIRPKSWTPDTHPLPLETTLGYFYSLAFALPELLLLLGIHAWYRQQG